MDKWAEYVLLEITFGYGVKPWKLLCSFLILWIPFSLYYAGFLRHPEKLPSRGIWLWNPFRDWCRCISWAAIHSFNILTRGIDFEATRFIEASGYELVKAESKRVVWIQRLQQILGWYLLALFLIMFGKIWIR